jgi:hypothetical protein
LFVTHQERNFSGIVGILRPFAAAFVKFLYQKAAGVLASVLEVVSLLSVSSSSMQRSLPASPANLSLHILLCLEDEERHIRR